MATGSFQNEIPKSRVNIKYEKHTGGASKEVELPLKLLVVGDYTQKDPDENEDEFVEIEDRKKININKNNFKDVMKAQGLSVNLDDVPDKLSGNKDASMPSVTLKFESMEDFLPENIATQVPELRQLLEVRKLLLDLRGRVVNKPSFRRKLAEIMQSQDKVDMLLHRLDEVAPLLSANNPAAPE